MNLKVLINLIALHKHSGWYDVRCCDLETIVNQ